MTEIKNENGNWNVYVDGNPKFGFVYKQEAEAVAEIIDALLGALRIDALWLPVEAYKKEFRGEYEALHEMSDKFKQALKKAGCIDE